MKALLADYCADGRYEFRASVGKAREVIALAASSSLKKGLGRCPVCKVTMELVNTPQYPGFHGKIARHVMPGQRFAACQGSYLEPEQQDDEESLTHSSHIVLDNNS